MLAGTRLVKWVTAAEVRSSKYDTQVSVGCSWDLDTFHGTSGTMLEPLLVVGCDGPELPQSRRVRSVAISAALTDREKVDIKWKRRGSENRTMIKKWFPVP